MNPLKKVWILVKREWHLFWSNSIAVAIFMGAPILYGVLFGAVYQQSFISDLPVTVVDYDQSPLSQQLIDAMDDHQYVEIVAIKGSENTLQKDLTSANIVATVVIPDGFEGDIQQKRYPEIQIDIDAANMVKGNYAYMGIRTVLSTINAGIEITALQKKGIPKETALKQFEAFKINTTKYYNPNSNYASFMWPGIMGTLLQQVFLLVMALSFAREFEEGRFTELLQITKDPVKVMTAKSLPYWLMGMVLWTGIQFWMFPYYHMPKIVDQKAVLLLCALFMLALTNIGTLVSWVLRSQLKATEILMVIATPSFIISGFSWPLSEMPQWIQWLAELIPLTHFLEAMKKLMYYQGGIQDIHTEIIKLLAMAITTGVICFGLVWLRLKKEKSLLSS